MPFRLTVAVVFAVFGALTVFAMSVVTGGGIWLNAGEFVIAGLAAFSAGIMAAILCRRIAARPVTLGIITMLFAQIPFSFLATAYLSLRDGSSAPVDIMRFFFMLLFFGWLVAGLFQVATGALAGLVIRRVLRTNPPQENHEEIFK